MLLIKTKLGISGIEGMGLFADQDIKKGIIISNNDDNFAIITYSQEQWQELENKLSKESFRQVKRYTYKEKSNGLYRLNLDDTRFINHSTYPNIETVGNNDIAIQNIKKGEEILIDYTTFYDEEYFNEIIK